MWIYWVCCAIAHRVYLYRDRVEAKKKKLCTKQHSASHGYARARKENGREMVERKKHPKRKTFKKILDSHWKYTCGVVWSDCCALQMNLQIPVSVSYWRECAWVCMLCDRKTRYVACKGSAKRWDAPEHHIWCNTSRLIILIARLVNAMK